MSVDKTPEKNFHSALLKYQRAKAKIGRISKNPARAIEKLDEALEALLASPSPSFECFHRKIEILDLEYGPEAQPRHMVAIYADVRGIAAAAPI